MNIYQQLEANQSRRMAAQDRYLKRLEKREAEAGQLVGELCCEGKTVYYINLRPLSKGRIKESTNQYDLIDYLIRNNYV